MSRGASRTGFRGDADLGVHPETLRKRVRQAEAGAGKRGDLLATQEREEIRRLRRENFELRRANEILKSASVSQRSRHPCVGLGALAALDLALVTTAGGEGVTWPHPPFGGRRGVDSWRQSVMGRLAAEL